MAPPTRNAIIINGISGRSSGDPGSANDGVRQLKSELVDEKLLGHQLLENVASQIVGLSLQQQAVQNGANRGEQVGRMARVEFPKFNGDNVRD